MRHNKKKKKLGRKILGQRRSFFRNLSGQLIENERIETTLMKAKIIRPKVERLISLAKKQKTAYLRLLLSKLPREAAMKLFYEIAKRYENRSGGYTRIIKAMKTKKRDGAEIAIIELVK